LNDQQTIKEVTEEIQKILESNETENSTYQNLWDAAKAVLRGKFIAMSTYIREISNSLTMYLNILEKQEQAKPQISRRKGIIKIWAEINEIETKKSIQKINETKIWFFEKKNVLSSKLKKIVLFDLNISIIIMYN
jgi:hypothetical protein